MSGGAHRGPAALRRQRRTIRIMQGLLVVLAAGLLMFAGYTLGRASGYDAGRRASDLGGPRRPSVTQTVVLVALGVAALAGALLLQGPGDVRVPSPARLDELTGRAEAAAVDKAQRVARSEGPGTNQAAERPH
jgi:hypothetical protein